MNALVIGGSGRVGKVLIEKLLEEGHQVTGSTRKKEALFEKANYRQISIDLKAPLDEIKESIPGDIDVLYFVSGSRGKDLFQVDLHGAIKSMRAAEAKGIRRYIMLSTIFATQPDLWPDMLPENMFDYYISKYYADLWLIHNSGLDYSILQPSSLTETQGSGKITVDIDGSKLGLNSIENVAHTLADLPHHPNTIKKVILMHDGEKPISEALAEV